MHAEVGTVEDMEVATRVGTVAAREAMEVTLVATGGMMAVIPATIMDELQAAQRRGTISSTAAAPIRIRLGQIARK